MKTQTGRTTKPVPWTSVEEAKEQIRRNSPERDYDVHYEVVTMSDGYKGLRRVVTPKEKHD